MIIASDLEGTLTEGATWRGLGSYLREVGRSAEYNSWYRRNLPHALLYRIGLIEGETFKNDWIASLLGFFAGRPYSEFDAAIDYVVDVEMWPQRRRDVLNELSVHVANGHRVIITSGTLIPIVERFAKRAGIKEVIATPVEIVAGMLTGRVIGAHNTGDQKLQRLLTALDGKPLGAAYGDTGPDIPVLELAQTSIAVYPDRVLRSRAERSGWRIIEG